MPLLSIDRHWIDRHWIDRHWIDRHWIDRHSIHRHWVARPPDGCGGPAGPCTCGGLRPSE
jgi:hypothetical protein